MAQKPSPKDAKKSLSPHKQHRASSKSAALDTREGVNVGRRLRELRAEQDLSIRTLAEKSGLAINTLSLIENAKTSPSVSTLQQIAVALDAPITVFFETDTPQTRIVYTKAGSRPSANFAHGTLADLGAGMADHFVQPFIITLEPNLGSGANPIVHTGHEFVYCLEGRITYTIEDHTYLLEPGDSLLFESHLPHRWQNVDAQPAQALLIMYPTDERDHPTERHFATN